MSDNGGIPEDNTLPMLSGQLTDQDPGNAVPAEFTAHKERKPLDHKTLKDPRALESFKGRQVDVFANGVSYRGLFQGSDGEEIYLRTETRYVTVSVERVVRVVPLDERPRPLAHGLVPHAFYQDLEEDGPK